MGFLITSHNTSGATPVTTTTTVTISSIATGDVVLVSGGCSGVQIGGQITGMTSPNLGTLTKRSEVPLFGVLGTDANYTVHLFYAVWTGAPLTNEVVTVTVGDFNGGTSANVSLVYASVAGANTSTPWDTGGSSNVPQTAISSSAGIPTVAGVTTNVANCLAVSFAMSAFIAQVAGTIGGTAATFLDNGAANGPEVGDEYLALTGALSSGSYTFGNSATNGWAMIADALQPATPVIIIPRPLRHIVRIKR